MSAIAHKYELRFNGGSSLAACIPGTTYPDVPCVSVDKKQVESGVIWRGGVRFKPSEDLMLYATASRGFRPGGTYGAGPGGAGGFRENEFGGFGADDVDLGDVGKSDLGAAGDAVFALTDPGVVGPVMSDLGPALFRMNGILAAQETTFDEAKDSLGEEMRMDAARRDIASRMDQIDDLLASGADLFELVAAGAQLDAQALFDQAQVLIKLAAQVSEAASLKGFKDKAEWFYGCVQGRVMAASRLG